MCGIPWCYAFCCEPRRVYRFYKRRKQRKEQDPSPDSSDNARIVSEKKPREREQRKKRSNTESREKRSNTESREKRRKSPPSSSEARGAPHAIVSPAAGPLPVPAANFEQKGPRPALSVRQPQLVPTRTRRPPLVQPASPPRNIPLPPIPPPRVARPSARPATVSEGQVLSPPPSPPQTTVVTYQEPIRRTIATSPELLRFQPSESAIRSVEVQYPADLGQKFQQDAVSHPLYSSYAGTGPPSPGPAVDVEIFATPSERRERSVSRVRRRSQSRPRSSYSSQPKDIQGCRDSHQSLYSESSRRGDDSDGSTPSIPPIPPRDRERSVYIDQTRKPRTQLENPGPLTRLVSGVMPEASSQPVEVPQDQIDPDYDFVSNIESLAREAVEEELTPRKCARRERKEREDRERLELEEHERLVQEEHQRLTQEEHERLPREIIDREDEERGRIEEWRERQRGNEGKGGKAAKREREKGQLSKTQEVNITITRTITTHRQPKTSGNSYPASQSDQQLQQRLTPPDSPKISPVILPDYQDYQRIEQPKVSFAYDENGPLPRSYKELRDHLSSHIVAKGLEAIIPADAPDPIAIARRAEAEADRICASLGISTYATPDLTKVGLYDIIVFCDDSGSMLIDGRFEDQRSVVQRISRIAQTYNRSGISMRFINYSDDDGFNHLSHGEINSAVTNVFPNGTTRIGTKLLEKVVFPFVIDPARRMELKKPVLISIITDGEPTEENIDTLKWTILACKKELQKFVTPRGLPYGKAAVTFQISRVGDSPESKRFLGRLANDPEIANSIFCNDETLDSAVRTAGSDSGALNTWLTQLLVGAVAN